MDILSKYHSTVVVRTAMAAVALTVVLLVPILFRIELSMKFGCWENLANPFLLLWAISGQNDQRWRLRSQWGKIGRILETWTVSPPLRLRKFSDRLYLIPDNRLPFVWLSSDPSQWDQGVRLVDYFQCWICIAIFTTSPRRTAGGELNNSSLGNVTFSSAKGRL